ncbi:hypothetical protein HPB52_008246 [Rhipicephalus sanguineus]|uniref:Serpin domain-containing protein n=1 Tax=Rhipicephalus sanguineus TaxID=34632 RepID=A0A9D4SVX7_RHISA|nr:hypothetical protein HPB52_008246 [Rhipicephalus sanguineus]
MFIIETFDFSHDDELNVDALRVPYADNQYSMILMLPRNRQSPLASVVQGLTAAKLNEIIGEMEPEQVELSLPKMSVGTRAVAATQAQFVSKSLVHFKQFTVDRPFLALIRHEPTGA